MLTYLIRETQPDVNGRRLDTGGVINTPNYPITINTRVWRLTNSKPINGIQNIHQPHTQNTYIYSVAT